MVQEVAFLTEELVRQGHEVTLFASGDSKASANLVRCCDMALRLTPSVGDTMPYHMIMLDEVRRHWRAAAPRSPHFAIACGFVSPTGSSAPTSSSIMGTI
jgi:hypothetical protein